MGLNKLKQKLSYHLDNIVRKTIYAQIVALFIIILMIIVLGGFFAGNDGEYKKIPFFMWWSLLHILDTGQLADDKELYKGFIGFIITLGGLFVFGALISIINNAFSSRIEKIRKGKIKVFDTQHTIILGWGSTVFAVVEQLMEGFKQEHSNTDSKRIVILANKDRDDMYDELYRYCFTELTYREKKKKLKDVLCRTGTIEKYTDLDMVNLPEANKVIILSDEDKPDKSLEDAHAVKALFSAINDFTKKKTKENADGHKITICLSVNDTTIADTLQAIQGKYPDISINVSNIPELLGKVMAQIILNPLLKEVYDELLSYDGNEIHICKKEIIQANGQELTFDRLYNAFPGSIPIGIISNNLHIINPSKDKSEELLKGSYSILVISEDNPKNLSVTTQNVSINHIKTPRTPQLPHLKNILVIGRGKKVGHIIKHITNFLDKGSNVYHSCDDNLIKNLGHHIETDGSIESDCKLIHEYANKVDIIVIADDGRNSDIHDSQVLIKIAVAKKMQDNTGNSFSIVAEFLDPRNAELASVVDVNVYIVSSKLASNYLVQVVNKPERKVIIDELLLPEGNEICLKPLYGYLDIASIVDGISFNQIMQLVRESNEVAIGYVWASVEKDGKPKVIINPGNRTELLKPSEIDSVVVIGNY